MASAFIFISLRNKPPATSLFKANNDDIFDDDKNCIKLRPVFCCDTRASVTSLLGYNQHHSFIFITYLFQTKNFKINIFGTSEK